MKRSAFTVASLIAALACGSESAGPTTGSLEVTAATTGSEPDLDGYTVAIDGSAGEPLAVDGTVTFAQLGTGNHAVRLSGVATHCTVGGDNPRTVSVTAGAAAHTTFQIACAALSGSEEHTSELQSPCNLVCRLLLEKKKKKTKRLEIVRSRHCD